VILGPALTIGNGLIVIVVMAVFVHPVAVIFPVTVYVVLDVGFVTVTEAPVVALNPAAGFQL